MGKELNRKKGLVIAAVISSMLFGAWRLYGYKSIPKPDHDIGVLKVSPSLGIAGESGTWRTIYTAGSQGIREGGSLKIQLPNGWHVDPWPYHKGWQSTDPNDDHYLTGQVSRENVRVHVSIGIEGIDGQRDRFGRTFQVKVTEGTMLPGDTLSVVIQSYAPSTAEDNRIRAMVDVDGDGVFRELEDPPSIRILPSRPESLLVIAPSSALVGEPVNVTITVLDRFFNPVTEYRSIFSLGSSDRAAEFPPELTFSSNGEEYKTVEVIFNTPGYHSLKVVDKVLAPQGVDSNPIQVMESEQTLKVFWGDLHSHSEISQDGYGSAEEAFKYAKSVRNLDFYALTDHNTGEWLPEEPPLSEGITGEEEKLIKDLITKYNAPGDFVTLLAYECSLPSPYGHYNVYFQTTEAPIFGFEKFETPRIEEFWAAMKEQEAIAIPHHTGILWNGWTGDIVDWSYCPVGLVPSIEIYSLWGASEFCGNPLGYETAYEQRSFGGAKVASAQGPHYARDAWSGGLHLGVVAGSDDHSARPGRGG